MNDFTSFSEYLLNWTSEIQKFISLSYYGGVFGQLELFVFGIPLGIAIIIIFFSRNIEGDIIDTLKAVLMAIIINSGTIINSIATMFFGREYTSYYFAQYTSPCNNIISGIILVLTLYSWDKFESGGMVFGFCMLTYVISTMNDSFYEYLFLDALASTFIVGVLGIIIAKRKHFYSAWILYFIFHIATRFFCPFIYLLIMTNSGKNLGGAGALASEVFKYELQTRHRFAFDFIIFAFVLIADIVLEKFVLSDKSIAHYNSSTNSSAENPA